MANGFSSNTSVRHMPRMFLMNYCDHSSSYKVNKQVLGKISQS